MKKNYELSRMESHDVVYYTLETLLKEKHAKNIPLTQEEITKQMMEMKFYIGKPSSKVKLDNTPSKEELEKYLTLVLLPQIRSSLVGGFSLKFIGENLCVVFSGQQIEKD